MANRICISSFSLLQNALDKDRRDPRFDATSGDFDKKIFRENYKFVDEIKAGERKRLQEELEGEDDEERREQIRYLIQRYVSYKSSTVAQKNSCHITNSSTFKLEATVVDVVAVQYPR